MNAAGFAGPLVSIVATLLVHGTALALVAWVLDRTVLSRARPAFRAALWTVVLLKFFVPPVLPIPAALSGWLPEKVARVAAPPPPASALESLLAVPVPRDELLSPARQAEGIANSAHPLPLLLCLLYVIAFLAVVPRSLSSSYRTWRRVRSLPEASPDVVEEVGSLARRIGLRRAPEVLTSPEGTSPFVVGIGRPLLVLPASLLERSDSRSREPLVLHELAHLVRGDLVVRLLQNAARLVFFFWPPVWWVCRSIERASEMACDEWALSASSVPPRVYAATLLDVVRRRDDSIMGAQALALARNGRFLQERFEMILKHHAGRSPRLTRLAIGALLTWAAFSLGGGAVAEQKEETAKEGKDVLIVRRGHPGLLGQAGSRWTGLLLLQPEADLDRDGKLTDDEAMAFAESRSAGEKARLLRIAPDADLDANGLLEGKEVFELLDLRLNHARTFGRRPRKVNPTEADLNRDGRITEQEAHEYLEKQPPDEPVQFEWATEVNEGGQKNVEKKVIRFDPDKKH
ncbi:MAG TPA: M56 family metallopeptidase [Thermoanaerobaculia bacterium]|nr:M56 family metallopeptidase [Thermoanaerobaculia bacterium]